MEASPATPVPPAPVPPAVRDAAPAFKITPPPCHFSWRPFALRSNRRCPFCHRSSSRRRRRHCSCRWTVWRSPLPREDARTEYVRPAPASIAVASPAAKAPPGRYPHQERSLFEGTRKIKRRFIFVCFFAFPRFHHFKKTGSHICLFSLSISNSSTECQPIKLESFQFLWRQWFSFYYPHGVASKIIIISPCADTKQWLVSFLLVSFF